MADSTFLKPKVGDPLMLRKKKNGQFDNPPLMMDLGGFSSSAKLAGIGKNLTLEKGGPQAKGSKPL